MTDPLGRRDPYPGLEGVDLHRERAELLEEIVSTPGPGQPATPARTRVLLAAGIAAALVVVGGGVWFATTGDDGGPRDTAAAAASTTATDDTASAATEPASPTSPTSEGSDGVRAPGVHTGRVLSPRECRRVVSGHTRAGELRRTLQLLSRVRALRAAHGQHGRALVYVARRDGHVLVVDRSCRVLRLEPRHRAGR